MKVNRLEIKDYQQFQDFTLDLTYPEGHAKAGQPLDKICLIGQSGTGKTTLLNVVSDSVKSLIVPKRGNEEHSSLIYQVDYIFLESSDTGFIKKMKNDKKPFFIKQYDFDWVEPRFNKLYYEEKLKNQVIYLETCLENHIDLLIGSDNRPLVHTQEIDSKIEQILFQYKTKIVIKSREDFSQEEFRILLLNELNQYDKASKEKLADFLTKANNQNIDKVFEEFKEWKTNNPNPRIKLADKLSPFLKEFNLKIDSDWADGGLRLKTLQDEEIEISVASTGSKQILLSIIPLVLLETDNRIILIDEPENSLYPDIQKNLIQYYTHLAPEAQFFFATHSPLIASQFEPWEIVELEFDEAGRVQRKKFFEGENHIANYTIYPQYLRWDSILKKLFDVNEDRNPLGYAKLNELTALEVKLRKLKDKAGVTQAETSEVWEEYEKLANLLDWHIDEKN
ncbi:MAG: AAA family ATPase [Microscillaceae bacterium]|jgi:predicted ATPase|nr:AAA family ATPase [Microscillaceae bacterium]